MANAVAEGAHVGFGRTLGEGFVGYKYTLGNNVFGAAVGKVRHQHNVGHVAGCNQATMAPTKVTRGGKTGGAIDGERVASGGDCIANCGV
jgi:hypothetical protein